MSHDRSPLCEAIFKRDAASALAAIRSGADVNEVYAELTLVKLAAYDGSKEVLRILIEAGAEVSDDALSVMGEMDMTDWKIDRPEEVEDYADVTRLLVEAGASPDVRAYDGSSLIEYFGAEFYRPIRDALQRSPRTKTSSESGPRN
jgi:hypothetical protein